MKKVVVYSHCHCQAIVEVKKEIANHAMQWLFAKGGKKINKNEHLTYLPVAGAYINIKHTIHTKEHIIISHTHWPLTMSVLLLYKIPTR